MTRYWKCNNILFMGNEEIIKIATQCDKVINECIQKHIPSIDEIGKEYESFVQKQSEKIKYQSDDFINKAQNCILKLIDIETQKKIAEKSNFFSAIVSYKLERFHSELLRMILDPIIEDIDNKEIVDCFLNSINQDKGSFKNKVFVKTEVGNNEYGYIDILIYDDKYAIIIENKMNGAIDQPNQLARYYIYLEKVMKKEILKIVYIPYFGLVYGPDFSNYTEQYVNYIPIIKEKLEILPVKVLLNSFINECEKISKNSVQTFIVGQYANLLENILGGTIMSIEKTVLREVLINFMSSKERIEQIKNIADVWNRRQEIVTEYICEKLQDNGYEMSEDGKYWRFKSIKNMEIVFYRSYSHGTYYPPFVGFFNNDKFKKITESEKNNLIALLNETFSQNYFSKEMQYWDKDWIVKELQMDNCTIIEDLMNETVKNLIDLKEKVKSVSMRDGK